VRPDDEKDNEEASASDARAIGVPTTIEHGMIIQRSKDLDAQCEAVRMCLETLNPMKCLLFIPDAESVNMVAQGLRGKGMRAAVPLHEAMGFTSGRSKKQAEHETVESTSLRKFSSLRQALQTGANSEKRAQGIDVPVLIASHSSARGLHFDDVRTFACCQRTYNVRVCVLLVQMDVVFVLGLPLSMDEYLHLAGRTGRQSRSGLAITILTFPEAKQLRSWQTPLGIQFEEIMRD
jgi:superfamily II DNA/RNA helicase